MKKFPNAFIIMLAVILLAWIATFLIPQGSYQRASNTETGASEVIPGSYQEILHETPDFLDLLVAIPEGLISRADLIALILLIGGCFFIIEKTGALGQGLQLMVRLLKGKEAVALVVLSFLFAIAGMTIGLQEEIIAMTPILIVFGRSMGYDVYTTLGMSFGSAILGAAFSPMNPFAVLIAQKEAQLPLMSGLGFRLGVLCIAFLVWNVYMLRYARNNRVEKTTLKGADQQMDWRNSLILILLVLTFGLVTYGLLRLDWGFNELSGCFFLLGIIAALLGKMGLNGVGEAYAAGFKEMIYAGVILGLAGSITIILQKGMVIDTVVYGLFSPLEDLPAGLSATGIMLGQSLLHIPVPSYSGQAILTMPILIPLSDLVGLSRQVCVLAYQYGAVNMDLLAPTNGALMAILAVANITFNKWLRFIWKPALLLLILSVIALFLAIQIGLN